ncbi:helix-turn-helix domain-containing protein [Rhizobium sp. CG5]|uniref:helix-turn-helix domain-containing protein n=1 Tax=Rhizobium sp. CG5 TaxID=2726076 RepID=UPI0025503BF1|nr:helix-turn-helix domain-containing protein [Rhizobium sp. CG5]MCM2472138.1 helix-turn-helix domain-containing protein [Rhizobium sp. CG5]
MSHDATNWAIKQRGLKPAVKMVLWHLADRHHPDNGCFPSQDTLAYDAEVPKSTLNVYLDELERLGLIARERRRQKGSQKQERTRYYFSFEPEFEQFSTPKPCPETGHGNGEAESRNDEKPSPENGESRVQNLDSNPVREPVREPVSLRESVSELEGQEDRKRIEHGFKRWYPTWPSYVSDSQPAASKAWFGLSSDERVAAAAGTEAYLAAVKASGRKLICSAGVYLTEKRWEKLPAVKAQAAAPVVSNAYSRPWMGQHFAGLATPMRRLFWTPLEEQIIRDKPDKRDVMWRDKCLKQGWPDVTKLHDKAAEFRGVIVASDVAEASAGFVAVKVGSEVWDAWRRLHHANQWPFVPDPGKLEYVQFPPIDETEHDLDHAVAEAVARFHQVLKAARNDDDAA